MAYNSDEAKNIEKMENTIRTQLSKSGDTIFEITAVEINSVRFVPASILSQLRRELLQQLEQKRLALHPKSIPFVENLNSRYYKNAISEQENVTNALSRSFYADHGVESITAGLDLAESTTGCRVMVTDYCIRREIGECLLKKPKLKGELYLERGRKKYKLTFDCKTCQMSLTDTL